MGFHTFNSRSDNRINKQTEGHSPLSHRIIGRIAFACVVAATMTACATRSDTYIVGGKSVSGGQEAARLHSETTNTTMAKRFKDADQPLQLIHSVQPVMPTEAKKRGLQGSVTAELAIEADGAVSSVTVVQSPDSLLSQAVIDAMLQWKFSPLVVNGVASKVIAKQSYTFKLD